MEAESTPQEQLAPNDLNPDPISTHKPKSKPKIVVILGATGSGKSKLAIDLASHFPVEIINSDSMQVYQGLDALTNKVPMNEQKGLRSYRGIAPLMPAIDVNHLKRKAQSDNEKITWQWLSFTNSAWKDNLQLYHWVRVVNDVPPTGDYSFAKYNKSVDVIKYTDEEYEKHLTHKAFIVLYGSKVGLSRSIIRGV